MFGSSSTFNPVLRRPSWLWKGIPKLYGIAIGCVLWMGTSVAHGQFWAPPDSLFKMDQNLVRFNPAIINTQYFCDHPWQPEDEELRMKRLTDPNIDPATGYIIPTADLISHTAILNFLTSLNVKLEPMSLGLVPPGTHDIPFESSGLPSGNYLCRITSVDTGESVAKSFVVTN